MKISPSCTVRYVTVILTCVVVVYYKLRVSKKTQTQARINIFTPNDLLRRRAVSPLKIKILSKNMRKNQQIHQ
jgi:hypothetical protein